MKEVRWKNVSTVVLIDLTDTSSLSQRRGLVAGPSAPLQRVTLFFFSFFSSFLSSHLAVWDSDDPSAGFLFSLFFPPISFVSHPLNITSTFVSSVCPFICHSEKPYFHF